VSNLGANSRVCSDFTFFDKEVVFESVVEKTRD